MGILPCIFPGRPYKKEAKGSKSKKRKRVCHNGSREKQSPRKKMLCCNLENRERSHQPRNEGSQGTDSFMKPSGEMQPC